MSLQRAGNPQAVDVKPAVCFNGHPCIFRRNIFDKTLSALFTAIKDKSLIKSLLQPLLFCKSLLAGHGAADVLLVNVLFRDMDIFHRSSPDFLHVYCIILASIGGLVNFPVLSATRLHLGNEIVDMGGQQRRYIGP